MRVRVAAGLAAAEDQQVGDDCGARGALVRAAGQPDRAGQVGQGGDLAAGGGVAGVHGVAGGHHGDQAAGADQVQGLDDEVVVDAVTAGVVQAVGQGERAERDVADRQVEAALAGPGVGEGLVDDVGVRVERGGDLGGDRLELDAGEPGAAGREADEVARSAARFQDPAAGEPELLDACPDGLDEAGVGVVRVQRVAGRRGQLRRGQQAGELVAGPRVRSPVGVEDLRDRAPARPAGQDCLLIGCRRAVLALDGAERGERGQVRADAGDGPGGGQVVLAVRAGTGGRLAVLGQFLLLGVHLRPQRVAAVDDQRPFPARRRQVGLLRVLARLRLGGQQDLLRQDDLLRLAAGRGQPARLRQVALPGLVVARQFRGQLVDLPGRLLAQASRRSCPGP